MKKLGWAPWAVIAFVWGVGLVTSSRLGLGDAEALYAAYGAHPSASYLDHPPLVGWLVAFFTALGGTSVLTVRLVAMICSAVTVIFVALTAAQLGGRRAAGWSSLALLGTPVFTIGLVATTPDAPSAALWASYIWMLGRVMEDAARTKRVALWRAVILGALLGGAFLAKHTGALLGAATFVVLLHRKNRWIFKTKALWVAAFVVAILTAPVIVWNLRHGWAGALHRLVWTQGEAGVSLRNLGALAGGQLLYVGPVMLPLLFWAWWRLWRDRSAAGPLEQILLASSSFGLVGGFALGLWSKVAEPHWPAIGYLPLLAALGPQLAAAGKRARRAQKVAAGWGVAAVAILALTVHTPVLILATPKDAYEPRYDLANELRGWGRVGAAIRQTKSAERPVVAAFYTQCAQLAFALSRPSDPPVRCVSEEMDDFDIWYGPFELSRQGAVFVTDNRFEHDPRDYFPGATVSGREPVIIERAGREVRRFSLFLVTP